MPGVPDRPLSEAGPWFVFMDYTVAHEVWALNPDGSGATPVWSLVDEQASDSYTLWPAPSGGRIALLQYAQGLRRAPVLRVLEIPSGKELAVVNLLPRQPDDDSLEGEARTAADQVWAAVGVWSRPAWSPDGRWLAFNAAIDGPSADVYVYDTLTNTIERLTDGPDQSVDLAWSPDGAYIVHGSADSLYYGYSGLGYGMLSAWAAPPDPDQPVLHLYDHVFHGYEYILGWLGNSRYLGDSLDGDSLGNCGYSGLRTVDIHTGPGANLLTGNYSLRALDPASGQMVLVLSPSLSEFDCPTSLEPGVYLFDINSRRAVRVPDIDPGPIMSATWSPQAGVFFLGGGDELLTVDPAGLVARYPSIEDLLDTAPVVAPGGDQWVLADSINGAMAIGTRSGELIPIEADEPRDGFWSLDGAWLFYFDGGLNLSAAPAPDFRNGFVVQEGLLSAGSPALVNP
jgi:WD40 repeat protein